MTVVKLFPLMDKVNAVSTKSGFILQLKYFQNLLI